VTDALDYGPPRGDGVERMAALVGAALHMAPDRMRDWIGLLGVENMRAVRLDGRVVAGLGLIWMGQWFGGVSVPVAGVTAVGVAPEQRGRDAGIGMLSAMLNEVRAAGVPLSTLYPATQTFYQRAGYERAGQRITYELPIDGIDAGETTREALPVAPGDDADLRRAYAERARQSSGHLDRPDWFWRLRLEPEGQMVQRFRVVHAGRTEGYVAYIQGSRGEPLTVSDLCVLTPEAGRRLLTLFSGYRSVVEHVTWSGGPLDPLVYLLAEPLTAGQKNKVRVIRSLDWMLRIVDVAGALTARGYPPGLRAELHFDVRDEFLPANAGRYVLTVAGGQGEARRGGQGRIRLGVRELAALYTGFMAPAELQTLGALAGPPADLARAGSVFAGPRPWLPDMF
jgi:predicted acetyltransferase